jgi:small subunit ribosomal protein S20
MPNIKSAAKRARTSEIRRVKNKGVMSLIISLRNDLNSAVASGDSAKSGEIFREYCSTVDKAAKKHVLKTTAADRRKSRAARKIATLKSA